LKLPHSATPTFFGSLISTNSSVFLLLSELNKFVRYSTFFAVCGGDFAVCLVRFERETERERRMKEKMLQRRRNGGVKERVERDFFIINKSLGLL
jgi:hypothetical protein